MNRMIQRRIAVLREAAERYRNFAGRMALDATDASEDENVRAYARLAAEATQEADELEKEYGDKE